MTTANNGRVRLQPSTRPRSMADVVASVASEAVRRDTLPSGFDPLDHVLEGGFRTRDLALVGGVPGVGKTVITLQWARNIAIQGHPVVYASYEHDERALLARLLLLEVGHLTDADGLAPSAELRSQVRALARGERDIDDAIAGNLVLRAAHGRLMQYAERLWVIRPSGTSAGLEDLERYVEGGKVAGLFIDYLQKIPTPGFTGDEVTRVATIAEGLKEIALDHDMAVVAVVAGDTEGLNTRRLQLHHLRGAAGLAYEADLILMLNDKFSAVSKRHSAYDPVRAEGFKQQIVLSIDKHREGQAGINLEFQHDFPHYRFRPVGGYVEERLIDRFMYPE